MAVPVDESEKLDFCLNGIGKYWEGSESEG